MEVFKIVVIRREGLSQVFGAVQLTVLSLPAMQRDQEGMGETGSEREDGRDAQEQMTSLMNWVLPLCF